MQHMLELSPGVHTASRIARTQIDGLGRLQRGRTRAVARRTPRQVPMKWFFGITERIVVAPPGLGITTQPAAARPHRTIDSPASYPERRLWT
jgi:hypothetical protein